MENPRFLRKTQLRSIQSAIGTPAYVYDQQSLEENALQALKFPSAFNLTVRFAMKACPNAAILKFFDKCGLHIDASSGHEVERALKVGINPKKISLSSQEFPQNFASLYEKGIKINACSLHQLQRFGKRFPGQEVGLRFNPGLGSGETQKTNVGGPTSSFGIWHALTEEVRAIVSKFNLQVVRIHTHIGSGSDPAVWQKVSQMSLNLVRQFPNVSTLNLGGGYKVSRMPHETSTNLQEIGNPVREAFLAFAGETRRQIDLEIEPGAFLVAKACALVASVQDIVNTGREGHQFLKLDTGMTEILRPSLYGAQHPIILIPQQETGCHQKYVVAGHCCESGDLLSPVPGQPDCLQEQLLPEASIGDLCVIEGAGAYCSSMSAKNYNSFPEAPEVLLRKDGSLALIRHRQTLAHMTQNEISLEL